MKAPIVTDYYDPEGRLDAVAWTNALTAYARAQHELPDESEDDEYADADPTTRAAVKLFAYRLDAHAFVTLPESVLVAHLGLTARSEEDIERVMVDLQRTQREAVRVISSDGRTAGWRTRHFAQTHVSVKRRDLSAVAGKRGADQSTSQHAESAQRQRRRLLRRKGPR